MFYTVEKNVLETDSSRQKLGLAMIHFLKKDPKGLSI